MDNRTTHGHTVGGKPSSTFIAWISMFGRCYRPKTKSYKYYGAKGIKVCDRWSQFENFLEDMGEKPGLEFTLDRIDNTADYEPSNCRWATWEVQGRNRSNVKLTMEIAEEIRKCCIRGESHSQIAKKYGITTGMVSMIRTGKRWKNSGENYLPTQEALTIAYNGKVLTLPEWSKLLGMSYKMLHKRLFIFNWPVEKALQPCINQRK